MKIDDEKAQILLWRALLDELKGIKLQLRYIDHELLEMNQSMKLIIEKFIK